MTKNAASHICRQALEASFDGPVPRSRLPEPEPLPDRACTYRLQRRIAARRQRLSAAKASHDDDLRRLAGHLTWLVLNEREAGPCAENSYCLTLWSA